jgi:hypothetical protein
MEKLKMKYKISCWWSVSGEMEIEANSLDEAINKAYDEALPEFIDYIDNSFQIDIDYTNELNPPERVIDNS